MGIVDKISWHTSKSGNKYGKLIINDLENSAVILVWKNFHKSLKELEIGSIVGLKVKHLDGETFSVIQINP